MQRSWEGVGRCAVLGTGVALALGGCAQLELDPPEEVIHARFDPDAKAIPMPTDILRDAEAGRLELPLDDDDLTVAEREFYEFLETMDGWSTTMAATVEFTAPIAPGTLDEDSLQVWHWRETPQRVAGVRLTLSDDETELTIDAPREGWERGGNYVVMLRGGQAGIEGKAGERLECDAAFYFLRLQEDLDVPEHERAFPGDTRAERQDNAGQLEEIRTELAPYFDFFEGRGLERAEIAALWSFTVTERVELAMDKASQRMPLPMDLLLDPETGRVDLPPAPWDSDTVVEAKEHLHDYDGFGTSQNLLFGFTGPVSVESITPDSVQLYRLGDPPRLVPAEVEVLPDGIHVEIRPHQQPLEERARYGVVVRDSVRDADGRPIAIMPVGHFVRARAPVFVDGTSQVDAVADDDARRVEAVRADTRALLDDLGDDGVLAAWTYTTMTVESPLDELVLQPDLLDVAASPREVEHMTVAQAIGDFPLGIGSMLYVGDVYNGTIESPQFLDPLTRGWRTDGGHAVEDVPFTMAVPRDLEPGQPAPVVIFGHGIMTERRFVLALADALAQRGFIAIAIDFPYHGERTYCWSEGPLSVPNPQTGELTPIDDPCADGYTCNADGRCLDTFGQPGPLRPWPIIGMPQASGAAFIEIEKIANTRDHFKQTLVDLSALLRSLKEGDWESVIGAPVDADRVYYAGQSLGGIIGATFVALSPDIKRAVLNVPGADTVDLFDQSAYFGMHVEAFFNREKVARDSFEGFRFMNVARWFMDAADPQGVAHRLTDNRDVLIQMATLDFIIPNDFTRKLEELSGAPRRDYLAEHAFVVIPIEPEYLRGTREMASFLAGELSP